MSSSVWSACPGAFHVIHPIGLHGRYAPLFRSALGIWKEARSCPGPQVVHADVTWDLRAFFPSPPPSHATGFSLFMCSPHMLLYVLTRNDLLPQQLTAALGVRSEGDGSAGKRLGSYCQLYPTCGPGSACSLPPWSGQPTWLFLIQLMGEPPL